MIKQYIIKYKVFSLNFEYEFKVYAMTVDEAITAFIKAEPIGIERYRISAILDV